jgi:ketosteroid isomerase-like protein
LKRYRSLIATAVAAVAVMSSQPAAAQSQSDPAAVMQQVAAAFSRDDRTAAIAMFTDNAIVVGGPCGGAPANGECIGRAMLEQAIRNSDPVHVSLNDLQVVGDGNTVTFRTQEQFELPPQAAAAGVHRMVELGTAVIVDGKVDRMALVPDITDAQTVTLFHLFASFGPEPGSPGEATATDGQSLASQSTATQSVFRAAYGDQAPAQWAAQHQASLGH